MGSLWRMLSLFSGWSSGMNKKELSERDICTKFITPSVVEAGWDVLTQIREEVYFTKGQVIVRGKVHTRGKAKFADYVLYHKTGIPLAIFEKVESLMKQVDHLEFQLTQSRATAEKLMEAIVAQLTKQN